MKQIYTWITILFATSAFGQSYSALEFNNTYALLNDGGSFFEGSLSTAAYEIPKGSGRTAIYSMGFWMSGEDVNSQLHSSCSMFNGATELFAGPISDDYNSSYYSSNFLTSMWTVNKADIDYHIANYSMGGYTMPSSIADWPGNGNPSEGVAATLAPYIDVNSNGTYDPVNGDYPYIEGGQATFIILNDENGTHGVAGGDILGVEVHVMFYQFSTSDDLNNTTFFHVNVYNRRSLTIYDFKFGVYSDFDLGNYQDDFWGSDSARNYMFAYNGDTLDEDGGGNLGYGANPPAIGIVSLSHDLNAAVSTSGQTTSTANDFNNLLNGVQTTGAPYVHSSGFDTKFEFSDDPDSTGFSEVALSNPPSDRRGLMSIAPITFAPGDNLCMDYAVVYKRDLAFSNVENAQALDGVVDFVQTYFDGNITPCANVVVGVGETPSYEVSVFPNPSNGLVNVTLKEPAYLQLYDTSGRLVYDEMMISNMIQMDLAHLHGQYILKIIANSFVTSTKIQLN